MLYQNIKDKIELLMKEYKKLCKGKIKVLQEISIAEIPEMIYNSNAIENSTLTLQDTEEILLYNQIKKNFSVREIYEAKNLANITQILLNQTKKDLTIEYVLDLHRILLTGISDDWAGRFRTGKEWVRVGSSLGANPKFVYDLMNQLVSNYNKKSDLYFLDSIAYFHAEFETIHPFCDGNGRMGRVLINQQLIKLGCPPVIIQNKNKKSEYYPLFDIYRKTNKYDGFTQMFALLLMESLHKRISLLTAKKIISLNQWTKENNKNTNSYLNKAKRQTIPAFRLREKWMISADFYE